MTGAAGPLLVLLVIAERFAELAVARRHTRALLAAGGREHGRGHYPFMVALHAALLAGCLLEPLVAGRTFRPTRFAAGAAIVAAAEALRWWTIATLGDRWTTRVIVLPGRPLVTGGPFRFLRHPNYLAVALEVAALPLSVGAWITAVAASLVNGWLLLAVRIPCEERALGLRRAISGLRGSAS
jgi:methyltransferase